MQKKVLITGANSLLGTHTIRELLDAGYAVKGLLRRLDSYLGVENPALELVEGEFTDENTLRRAMRGCDCVIHCAAKTGQSGRHSSYKWVNVTSTERLVEVAIECGVRRVVNVASANVFAYGTKERPGDETEPIAFPYTESAYANSKFDALQRLGRFRGRIEIVSVCPTFMLGAWDSRPSSGRIVLMGYGRRIMLCPPGGKNFVAAADVARGVVAALERGCDGERYLLSGYNLTYAEFYRMLANRNGYRQSIIRVPAWMLRVVGAIGDLLVWFGVESEISSVNMRILCIGNYYTNNKSVRELNLQYRPLSEAVDETVEWFRRRGMLPKSRR